MYTSAQGQSWIENPDKLIKWLMDGDPSIRWQVMRDLLNEDELTYASERRKVGNEGWGAQLLSFQEASGRWGGQLYSNKWLSTTYTLQLLRQMGLETTHPQAHLGCRELLEGGFHPSGGISYAKSIDIIDVGVTGMVLAILAYFNFSDERLHRMAEFLVNQQIADGRWEPVPGNENLRYAFDTTLLVLDGLYEYELLYPGIFSSTVTAQERGRDFLLAHNLYQFERSGVEIDKKVTLFSFPPRWHYDVLTALDYFQHCQAGIDQRMSDAIAMVVSKRKPDGCWILQNRHAGKTYFEMEAVGKPSRWNTLRALRVLKRWMNDPPQALDD